MTLIRRLKRVAKEATGEGDVRIEEQLKEISHRLTKLEEAIADLKPNIKMLPAIVRKLYLDGVELPPPYDVLSQRFRIRSQNEEDGLLLALFKRIGTTNRRCVEIGCGSNGGNSGFLVQECGWTGLMVDANRAKIATVRIRFAGHGIDVPTTPILVDALERLASSRRVRARMPLWLYPLCVCLFIGGFLAYYPKRVWNLLRKQWRIAGKWTRRARKQLRRIQPAPRDVDQGSNVPRRKVG